MRTFIWILILLAAIAFILGGIFSLFHLGVIFGIKPPVTFWRGAIGFLLFAIALKLMMKE